MYFIIRRAIIICREDKLPSKPEDEGVSIIITTHNSAEALKRNLPGFLMQVHEKMEVIVVDECSEDDTQDVLSDIQKDYPELRCTRIFPDTKFRFTKKLAINIGVLAAKYDILLFSEIHCRPSTLHWARAMHAYFDEKTAAVVGYANYAPDERQVSVWRAFRFLRFLEMSVLTRKKTYLFGDGCNMAYRKSCYIKNRGFAKNSQSYLGYDNDMIRELSKLGTVKITRNPDTRVIIDKREKEGDMNEISYHYASKMKLTAMERLGAEKGMMARLSFYTLSIYLIIMDVFPLYLSAILFIAFLTDFVLLNICAICLKQKKIFLTSFVISTVGFVYKWYWNGCSFFNRRKWS